MKRFLLAFCLLLAALPARAERFASPTWGNLLNILVNAKGLDLGDDKILDEYADVAQCNAVDSPGNLAELKKNPGELRDLIHKQLASFPSGTGYQGRIAIDHYDAQGQRYIFSDSSPLHQVSGFSLLRSSGIACGDKATRYLPRIFNAVLNEPVTLPALPQYLSTLPISERVPNALFKRMEANGNPEHYVWVRFEMHINAAGKAAESGYLDKIENKFSERDAERQPPVLFSARVDNIGFYEDEQYSKLLWAYQPNSVDLSSLP